MNRRGFLGLAAGAAGSALAGCTATALPGPNSDDDSTPATIGPGADCPTPVEADRTVCADGTTAPLDVERSPGRVAGDDWSLRVTVTNRSGDAYGTNPYAWSVFRRDGDGWTRVAPDARPEPWTELGPGASFAWLLSAADRPASGADHRVFLDLEPDRYAFVVPFDGPDRVAAVARFDLTS